MQKARKLIESDKVDFLLGNVNSALALAMAQVSNEKGILHIVPGGHTDAITGASCHWNVFRVCNTTQMEANAVAGALIKAYGKKFYYITPDYAFGHTLETGLVKAAGALGGERVGGDLVPLGSVDFSSYLIKAQAANPDVIIFLTQGDDMLNALKQAVQFGLENKVHLAGAQQELEPLEGSAARRAGRNLGDGMVLEPARRAARRRIRRGGRRSAPAACRPRAPGSATSRPGPARTPPTPPSRSKAVDMAKTLQGFHLPPEIALGPNPAFYRAGQNQLIASLFVGHAQARASRPTICSRSPRWSRAPTSPERSRRPAAR